MMRFGIVVILAALAWAALHSTPEINVTVVRKSSERLMPNPPRPMIIAKTLKLEI